MGRTNAIRAAVAGAILAISASSVMAKNVQTAIFAGGCFWCVEADMDKIDGVISTVSGFTGGHVKNVTYKQVTKGGTGHYEAVKIEFDADKIRYADLLHKFWRSIDPLDGGGQFCDRGFSYSTAMFVSLRGRAAIANRYRSAVFAVTPQQGIDAETSKKAVEKALGRKVETELLVAGPFYLASKYHQDYYKQSKIVLTRFGPKSKAEAYKRYRKACGRDARVKAVWGAEKFPAGS